jgi:hypothetical protein
VLDYRYILININNYTKERLLQSANLISTVFLLDQEIDEVEYIRRFQALGDIVPQFDVQGYRLFWTWFEQISSWALPEALRQELLKIRQNTKPGEERAMISNMGRNLQRYYDEAILKGKMEGKLEGKLETAKSLLCMKLDVNLVSEATGLPLGEIKRLMQEL